MQPLDTFPELITHFGIFRAQGTCLVAVNVVLLRWGANRVARNPLVVFEGVTYV